MKEFIRKITAAALAGAMVLCASGCDKEKEESSSSGHNNLAAGDGEVNGDVAEEDMPYGASITQIKAGEDGKVKIGIEYDNRFLNEAEAIKISDYVAALNTADAELMEQTFYPPYLAYSVEQNGKKDTKEYLETVRSNLNGAFAEGGKMDMDYILVDECYGKDFDSAAENFAHAESILKSEIGEDISSKINSRKMVGIDIMFSIDGEGSYSLANHQGSNSYLLIYEIDGKIYIL